MSKKGGVGLVIVLGRSEKFGINSLISKAFPNKESRETVLSKGIIYSAIIELSPNSASSSSKSFFACIGKLSRHNW